MFKLGDELNIFRKISAHLLKSMQEQYQKYKTSDRKVLEFEFPQLERAEKIENPTK